MYDDVVTLFNFHAKSGAWYTTVFHTHLLEVRVGTATRDSGITSSDTVELILHTFGEKKAPTVRGGDSTKTTVQYVSPKDYAKLDNPSGFFTLKPEADFFVLGSCPSETPIPDDEHDEGLYHAMNDTQDGVYMITSVAFYGLIPHFEIGGR